MREDNRKPIFAETFGQSRYVDLFKIQKNPNRRSSEVFFSIEKIKSLETDPRSIQYIHKHGYMERTTQMDAIFATLFQDNRNNQSIQFIQWKDGSYNVVFEDGIYISQVSFRMEAEEFKKFEKTIRNAEEC